jgi:magnesium-protoporphyrin O-methyltransferase
MRATLLSWLPQDMSGLRLLDAGCGTGALSQAAAVRGAAVTAVDIAGGLVELGRERIQAGPGGDRIDFKVGDMLDPALGAFDYVVAMDSLIHYPTNEIVQVLARLAPRVAKGIVFTVAPRTPALTVMLAMGRAFPRSDRSPAIEPVWDPTLRRGVAAEPALADFTFSRTKRIIAGFYTSQAMELVRR